ncbi:hypothetical protein [Collimonas sp. PA-H2]|uniref:hypothetical protein n=1 Tax=Collimonas sp. PA-H2 TaxID=1881062 RepID=UPI000BF31E9B|nr:hypothetical protein [Collimonas sp. PA-H2]
MKMSGAQIYNQVDFSALNKLTEQHEASWVNQPVSAGTVERFQVLLNGRPEQAGVASGQSSAANSPATADNGKSGLDDVFHREELMQAVAAMSNLKPHEIPAAAARVTMISLDMQMKVDAVKQGSKSSEDSVQSMLRA